MKHFYLSFLSIILTMAIFDGLWLSFTIKRFYEPQIGHLMGTSIKITPAVLFYILYAVSLTLFVVLPGLQNNSSYLNILIMGMLFGLVTYGTYDLTSHATLKNWPAIITIVDMLWGSLMTGTISVISTYLNRSFL